MTPKQAANQDFDLANVGRALVRAARRARERAEQTRTPLYVWKAGGLVNLNERTGPSAPNESKGAPAESAPPQRKA